MKQLRLGICVDHFPTIPHGLYLMYNRKENLFVEMAFHKEDHQTTIYPDRERWEAVRICAYYGQEPVKGKLFFNSMSSQVEMYEEDQTFKPSRAMGDYLVALGHEEMMYAQVATEPPKKSSKLKWVTDMNMETLQAIVTNECRFWVDNGPLKEPLIIYLQDEQRKSNRVKVTRLSTQKVNV